MVNWRSWSMFKVREKNNNNLHHHTRTYTRDKKEEYCPRKTKGKTNRNVHMLCILYAMDLVRGKIGWKLDFKRCDFEPQCAPFSFHHMVHFGDLNNVCQFYVDLEQSNDFQRKYHELYYFIVVRTIKFSAIPSHDFDTICWCFNRKAFHMWYSISNLLSH